jgi:hypothetical protein
MAAANVGIVEHDAVSHLPEYESQIDAFEAKFGIDGQSVSRKISDWWKGVPFHSPFVFSRAKRSAILRARLRHHLSDETQPSLSLAANIVNLFANNVWYTRPWDAAEAMWYEGGALASGTRTTSSPLQQSDQQQVVGALIEAKKLHWKVADDGMPDSLRVGGRVVESAHTIASDWKPGDGNFDPYVFAHDLALAFRPAVLRRFPSQRTYEVPMPPTDVGTGFHTVPKEKLRGYVKEEKAELQRYSEAGVTTPEIIAEGTDYYVRGRVFGPRVDHLEDPFYGLAADSVREARKAWQQVPDALVTAGLMVQPTANKFAGRNAVYNLKNGKWTVVRPLVKVPGQPMFTI